MMRLLPCVFLLSSLIAGAAPSWDFTITNPALTAQANSTAIFRYSILNSGTEDLGFSNLTIAASLASFGSYTQLIDPLLFVPAGASATGDLFQIALLPGASGTLTGTAFLTAQFADPDGTVDTIPGTFSVTAVSAAVPEPGTGLLITGGLALAAVRRVRAARASSRRSGI